MPSASPTATTGTAKRASMHARSSSGASLSPSGKHTPHTSTAAPSTKPPRPHLVSRHSRNVSHGRALSNMPKKSMSQIYGDGHVHTHGHGHGRHHKRVKSGTTTPSASPRNSADAQMKRNSSHVVLPKNRSHGNLRKNKSTNALTVLNRNLSRGALNKLGAPAEQKAREEQQQKQGVFDLGDASSDEEEGEWEDSTASPELTRNNTRNNSANASKVPTPARPATPDGEAIQKPPDPRQHVPDEKSSSPPEPSVLKNNKSAPDLRYERAADPTLLLQNGRASRAPPAVTTANARSSSQQLPRNESQRSLAQAAQTSLEDSQESSQTSGAQKTPTTPGFGMSSSGSAGVSHFLTNDSMEPAVRTERIIDDDDSVSDFMATYKPQPSESPEKSRTILNRARLPSQPSRTQQKLELQRREVMRGNGPPPPASAGMALSVGSSVSLHSRSASKGRTRSMPGEYKAIKQDYENSIKQLTVIRRFRNPVLESLSRIKQHQSAANENASPSKPDQKRPPSRRGQATASASRPTSTVQSTPAATPPEHNKTVSFRPGEARPNHGRDSRVTFQLSRQGSHEDILTTSRGSPEAHHDEYNDGLSPEEALIRRMWESRVHVA